MIKYEVDANSLDNKNRARFSYNFANKKTLDANNFDLTAFTNNRNYVFRAFAYIKDSSNNIYLSDKPVYFTIYDIASIENGTSSD